VSTIRSYGEMARFLREEDKYIDLENRALFLTVTNQRLVSILLSTYLLNLTTSLILDGLQFG